MKTQGEDVTLLDLVAELEARGDKDGLRELLATQIQAVFVLIREGYYPHLHRLDL